MIEFPRCTSVHRRIPKEAFYKRLPMNSVLREKFVSDVDRIYVENSLTKDNLNLTADTDIKEILFLGIILKKREFDRSLVEAIARQNPHNLVFNLIFENYCQLALYSKKLYLTPWVRNEDAELQPKGNSLREIWDSFVEQIALHDERASRVDSLKIEERLELQGQIIKLEKEIKKTESAVWKEQQPKKRFELFSRLQKCKQVMEELKRGQT